MPTVRTRRRRNRVEGLTPFQLAFLLDRELPEPSSGDEWWRIVESGCDRPGSAYQSSSAGGLWRQYCEYLMVMWLQDHPG
jgi:hypothetical protein